MIYEQSNKSHIKHFCILRLSLEGMQERFAVSGNEIFLICLDLNTSAGFIQKSIPFVVVYDPPLQHINFLGISMRCVHHFFEGSSYNFDKPRKEIYTPLLCIPQERTLYEVGKPKTQV